MNKPTEMQTKIAKALENEWPQTRAVVSQLMFEGAHWYDEGTHIALMVWVQDCEQEMVAATMAFDVEGNLGELEECFGGMDSYILDEWS